jgi:hypothetical protein
MVFKHFTVEGNSGFDERYYSPALEPIGYLHANGRASKSGNRRLGISPDAARRRNARNRTKDKLVEVLLWAVRTGMSAMDSRGRKQAVVGTLSAR